MLGREITLRPPTDPAKREKSPKSGRRSEQWCAPERKTAGSERFCAASVAVTEGTRSSRGRAKLGRQPTVDAPRPRRLSGWCVQVACSRGSVRSGFKRDEARSAFVDPPPTSLVATLPAVARKDIRNRPHATTLRHSLTGPGRPWRRLDVVEETGSTNADLLARAAAGEDIDGAVLIAESQTAGRGRHGRSWSTPPRSQVALSVGVGVGGVPSDAWGWLPLLTGVAVVDAVAEVAGVTAGLKWPNDVLVGAGSWRASSPRWPHQNRWWSSASASMSTEAPDPAATSLSMLDAPGDRTKLAEAVLRHLAARIASWRAAGGRRRGAGGRLPRRAA